jgi:uncharacterized SAM-binding protein YcdF (DUF218 family)
VRRLPLGLALGGLIGLVVKDLDLAAVTPFEGSREALAVIIAVVVAVVWAFGFRRLVAALSAGALALWCLVAFTPLSTLLASGLVRSEAIEPADAVFVSYAALSPGEPARAEARSRLLAGVELVARGKAPIVVVPRGDESRVGALAEVVELLGVAQDKVVPLAAGDNTHEEAVALAQLYREKQWRLVIVVTSPLHSSRMGSCLSREGVNAVLAPSTETRFDVFDLSRASDRIDAFGSVIHEQVGRLVYRLRGWS